jgi:arylsulfatase
MIEIYRSKLIQSLAVLSAVSLFFYSFSAACSAPVDKKAAPAKVEAKPNILVIWGDDIGISNISAYSDGIMGYTTPNIDRIANEGMRFTDYYGEQTDVAAHSSFITGQSGLRTGLTKAGLPGMSYGIQDRDITIAEIVKTKGYVTGQFGKHHLGDRDKQLPTNHGFDEFFGNLYDLSASIDQEDPDYPKDPVFKKMFAPRGVLHSFAVGKIEDTGPLTKKRMETIDEEFVAAAKQFIDTAVKHNKPFFVWLNTTGMQYRTHSASKHLGKSGQGLYNDVMVAHDEMVGEMLTQLDELKIADNTVVVYSTDNGVQVNTWPDVGITPFRGGNNRNYEGAYRVPAMVRWPGKIAPGTVSNEIMSHLDWMPTLAAVSGDPTLKNDLLIGRRIGNKATKLHLDGYNFLPYLTGNEKKGPRDIFHYLDEEAFPVAIRLGDWKVTYVDRRDNIQAGPFALLRKPKVANLRRDPYEQAEANSSAYDAWKTDKTPYVYLGYTKTSEFLATFKQYAPSQSSGSTPVATLYELFSNKAQGF